MYRLVSDDNDLKQSWKNPTILAELNTFCCCILGELNPIKETIFFSSYSMASKLTLMTTSGKSFI